MKRKKKKFSILIVDDVAKNIQVVANILKGKEYQMAFARSGAVALEHTTSTDFDLILLDIMMPGMDGYEVCKRLKESPGTKDIPIIFLTAKTDPESILKGFELGAADYVTKPFNPPELLARVNVHLELRQANQQLRKLNATKDKFFSIIAHDLRNPFNTLITGSDFLINYFDTLEKEQLKDFLWNINTASKNTFNLLINLLEWSQSQTGHLTCEPKRTDICGIVNDNMALLRQTVKNKMICLINDVRQDTFVFADANMISTVIRNLLTNALKYTAQGEIRVTSESLGDFVEISVSDTGMGIEEQDMDNLFRLEEKLSTPGTAGEQGSGLGLILCKEFVEKNNGKIWAKSNFGKGSCFRFILPKSERKRELGL